MADAETPKAGPSQAPAPARQPAEAPGPDTVHVDSFKFEPAVLEVRPGTTVTWRNVGRGRHSVNSGTADQLDGKFDGELPEMNSTFTHTFSEPGEYPYVCGKHPRLMQGKVIVR